MAGGTLLTHLVASQVRLRKRPEGRTFFNLFPLNHVKIVCEISFNVGKSLSHEGTNNPALKSDKDQTSNAPKVRSDGICFHGTDRSISDSEADILHKRELRDEVPYTEELTEEELTIRLHPPPFNPK